jgi:hypothetical protein
MADDVAAALNNVQKGAIFTATPADHLQVPTGGGPRAVRHLTIQRTPHEGGDVEATVDLYELEYLKDLAARQERQSIVVRAAMVALTLLSGARQFLAFTPLRQGKTVKERAQLLLMLLILALYAAFLGILVVSIISLITQTWEAAQAATQAGGANPTPSPSALSSQAAYPVVSAAVSPVDWLRGAATSFAGRVAQLLSLVAAFVWLVLPPKAKIKEAIANTATDYLGAQWYLSQSIGAPRISGGFVGTIGKLVDLGEHGRIDVVSYSLGSVIAINQLFPADGQLPPQHALRSVKSLVTVGSPYDVIRLLLPNYFKGRQPVQGVPERWLNIYTPDDILGSNFRNDGDEKHQEETVMKQMAGGPAAEVAFPTPVNVAYLPGGVPGGGGPFGGLRVHGAYWGEEPGDQTCWGHIVPVIYGDHVLLAPSAPAQASPASPLPPSPVPPSPLPTSPVQ